MFYCFWTACARTRREISRSRASSPLWRKCWPGLAARKTPTSICCAACWRSCGGGSMLLATWATTRLVRRVPKQMIRLVRSCCPFSRARRLHHSRVCPQVRRDVRHIQGRASVNDKPLAAPRPLAIRSASLCCDGHLLSGHDPALPCSEVLVFQPVVAVPQIGRAHV